MAGKPFRDDSQILGETVLSHKWSGSAEVSCRSSEIFPHEFFVEKGLAFGVPFGMGNPKDFEELDPEKTALFDELFETGAICSVKSSSHRTFSRPLGP